MVLDFLITLGVSFLLIATGFCVTLHIAARYVLGDVEPKRALVAIAPAVVVVSATQAGYVAAGAILAIGVDFLAIRRGYGLENRNAAFVTVIHYVVSIIIAFTIRNLLLLLGTVPG